MIGPSVECRARRAVWIHPMPVESTGEVYDASIHPVVRVSLVRAFLAVYKATTCSKGPTVGTDLDGGRIPLHPSMHGQVQDGLGAPRPLPERYKRRRMASGQVRPSITSHIHGLAASIASAHTPARHWLVPSRAFAFFPLLVWRSSMASESIAQRCTRSPGER